MGRGQASDPGGNEGRPALRAGDRDIPWPDGAVEGVPRERLEAAAWWIYPSAPGRGRPRRRVALRDAAPYQGDVLASMPPTRRVTIMLPHGRPHRNAGSTDLRHQVACPGQVPLGVDLGRVGLGVAEDDLGGLQAVAGPDRSSGRV